MKHTLRSPKANRARELCAYCGERRSTPTGDHVLPLALFPDPKLPDRELIIVPACEVCNKALAKHQDFLRDWLVTDFRCSSHPAARQLLEGPVSRSVGYKSSKLAKAAQQEGRQE